ncbi:homoprotocatechuate degradation operon regulator, HpaR [Pollutimonas bauzanensis]|uniref:Homoprotocatechuate degradation operon regulator, HpaR n=2 Tax=Pollutimonas bauzanensis TaxID=658167 RepID=A0A1M5X7B6_9BURK|nr:homoprotocatechuate degradation operon regulator, HpaR [Pollutimonas bauzanensis]
MALLRAREAVMAKFRPTLRDHGLTEQQWRVLRALNASKVPLRAGELSEQTFISMPSLSRLLKTLEARDAIQRHALHEDLRAAQLSISRGGKALVAIIGPLSEASYAEIAALIGDQELSELERLLTHVVTRLNCGR